MKLKRFLGILFSVALMLAAMSVTAYAVPGTAYSSFIPTSTDDANNLAAKQVIFNGIKWYIINDNSSSATEGTLTLFAADTKFGVSVFDNTDPKNNDYSQSDVKNYLDNVVNGTAGDGKPNFNDVNSAINTVEGGKLYLLSKEDLNSVPINVRKITGFSSTNSAWWLRTPGTGGTGSNREMHVGGDGGTISELGNNITNSSGVRPALQLDLSKVVFNSNTKEFSLKVDVTGVSLSENVATLTVGEAMVLKDTISPDNASDRTVIWSVGGTNQGAVELYSDSACTTKVGTGAVDVLTVYVKGVSTGNAIVTVTSNSNSEKSASCSVTVNPVPHTVELTGGANATANGRTTQTGLTGAMATVTYTADSDYIFPESSDNYKTTDGITVARSSDTVVTVSGTPTADVKVTVPDAVAKTKISQTVTFKVVNGSWNDESAGDKTVTLTGYEGDELKLSADQIPAVGSKPDKNFKAGSWDTEPDTKTVISSATTYTYKYAKMDAADVTKAPSAKDLTENGSAQALVNEGTASGGTMQYTLGSDGKTAPEDGYKAAIPTGTKAGTYYVWYMAKGDDNHTDSEKSCVTVEIKEKKEAPTPAPEPETEPETEPERKPKPRRYYVPESSGNTTYTPVQMPELPSGTMDAFTGVTETIDIIEGKAVVRSISAGNAGSNNLTITGLVRSDGNNYPVTGFATDSFNGVTNEKIVIDLKTSGNTEPVVFMQKTFKGSASQTLFLHLTSAKQVRFESGAWAGSNIDKIVVKGLKKSEFKKVYRKLRASGFKGKIVRK